MTGINLLAVASPARQPTCSVEIINLSVWLSSEAEQDDASEGLRHLQGKKAQHRVYEKNP